MPSFRNSGKTDKQSTTTTTTTTSTKAAAVMKGIVPPAAPHHGASDSLISFESWDYSATADTACTTIETIGAGASSSIASQSSVDVFDDEENDFTLTTTTNTTTPSTIGHIMGETTTTNAADDDDDVPKQDESTIQVSVSGVIFSLKTSTFEQLHGLPWTWQQEGAPSYSQGDSFVGYSLGTSPLLFDHLLNHVLFGSLPVLQDLSTVDAEELEPLASLLRLENLRRHLDRKLRPHQNFAFLRRSSSCGSRSLSGDNPSSSTLAQQPLAACHHKQEQQLNQCSFAFLKRSMLPPPSTTGRSSTTSSTTGGRGRCLIDASPGASPVALIRKRLVDKSRSILLRPPSAAAAPRHHLQNRRRHHHRQLSLEQLCAISDQLQ